MPIMAIGCRRLFLSLIFRRRYAIFALLIRRHASFVIADTSPADISMLLSPAALMIILFSTPIAAAARFSPLFSAPALPLFFFADAGFLQPSFDTLRAAALLATYLIAADIFACRLTPMLLFFIAAADAAAFAHMLLSAADAFLLAQRVAAAEC